jgi:pentatricopeptide repeat protein
MQKSFADILKQIPISQTFDPSHRSIPLPKGRSNVQVSSGHQVLPQPDLSHFRTALLAKDPKTAWKVYQQLFFYSKMNELSPDDHTSMLGICCQHHLPQYAASAVTKILKNMDTLQIALDPRDYALSMFAYMRSNDISRMMALLRTVPDTLRPISSMYTPLMYAYAKARLPRKCVSIYEMMVRNVPGSEYDPEAIAIMIYSSGLANDVSAAESLFDKVSESIKKGKLRWDRRIVDSLIRCYSINGRMKEAETLLKRLENRKFSPAREDIESFDAILEGCNVNEDPDTAQRIWNKLSHWCVKQSLKKKRTLIDLGTNEPILDPYSVFSVTPFETNDASFPGVLMKDDPDYPSTLQHLILPSRSSYVHMIRSHCQPNHLSKALGYFYMYLRDHSVPHPDLYSGMVHCLQKVDRPEEANEWLNGMESQGYPTDFLQRIQQ